MTIQVQLRRDIPELGRAGEVVSVTQAYARNFLLPRGAAIIATPKVLADVQRAAATRMADESKARAIQAAFTAKLAGQTIRLVGRASSAGKLFAAIKKDQLRAAISTHVGLALPLTVQLQPDQLKSLGDHPVTVRLGDQAVTITFHIDHGQS